jgi:hypothetical protein
MPFKGFAHRYVERAEESGHLDRLVDRPPPRRRGLPTPACTCFPAAPRIEKQTAKKWCALAAPHVRGATEGDARLVQLAFDMAGTAVRSR